MHVYSDKRSSSRSRGKISKICVKESIPFVTLPFFHEDNPLVMTIGRFVQKLLTMSFPFFPDRFNVSGTPNILPQRDEPLYLQDQSYGHHAMSDDFVRHPGATSEGDPPAIVRISHKFMDRVKSLLRDAVFRLNK